MLYPSMLQLQVAEKFHLLELPYGLYTVVLLFELEYNAVLVGKRKADSGIIYET